MLSYIKKARQTYQLNLDFAKADQERSTSKRKRAQEELQSMKKATRDLESKQKELV